MHGLQAPQAFWQLCEVKLMHDLWSAIPFNLQQQTRQPGATRNWRHIDFDSMALDCQLRGQRKSLAEQGQGFSI